MLVSSFHLYLQKYYNNLLGWLCIVLNPLYLINVRQMYTSLEKKKHAYLSSNVFYYFTFHVLQPSFLVREGCMDFSHLFRYKTEIWYKYHLFKRGPSNTMWSNKQSLYYDYFIITTLNLWDVWRVLLGELNFNSNPLHRTENTGKNNDVSHHIGSTSAGRWPPEQRHSTIVRCETVGCPVPVFLAADYLPRLQVCLLLQNHWLEKTRSSVPRQDSLLGLIVQIYCFQSVEAMAVYKCKDFHQSKGILIADFEAFEGTVYMHHKPDTL